MKLINRVIFCSYCYSEALTTSPFHTNKGTSQLEEEHSGLRIVISAFCGVIKNKAVMQFIGDAYQIYPLFASC